MVLDDEDRPRRFVEALDDTVEMDERALPLHGRPQAHIVAMIRIRAAMTMAHDAAAPGETRSLKARAPNNVP